MDKLTTATHNSRMALWMERIRSCKSSGMKVKHWCEENNVGIKTYYYWMRKIKREAFEALPSESLVTSPAVQNAITPVFSKIELPKAGTSSAAVTIRMSGMDIEIQNEASANTIKNILRAVTAIC